MKENQTLRQAYIEYCLLVNGKIHRREIVQAFGISKPQATNDLATFRRAKRDQVMYDPGTRQYLPTTLFKPAFILSSDLDELLEAVIQIVLFRANHKGLFLCPHPAVKNRRVY